jgi:tRNA(Ile)-lysidine synthase
MARLRAQFAQLGVRALHVNHHLQPHSDAWARHCANSAADIGVECVTLDVQVSSMPRESMEAAARLARYAALAAELGDGEYLLTAHHRDDQLETVLLQLLRGAGVAGLSGMPASTALGRGRLLRPVLGVARADLVAYATAAGKRWIEDLATRYAFRSQFSRELLPRPATLRRQRCVSRSADTLPGTGLLMERARDDLALSRAGVNLRVAAFLSLEPARARILLR